MSEKHFIILLGILMQAWVTFESFSLLHQMIPSPLIMDYVITILMNGLFGFIYFGVYQKHYGSILKTAARVVKE